MILQLYKMCKLIKMQVIYYSYIHVSKLFVDSLADKMVLRSFSILTIVAFGLCLPNKLYLPVPTCKRDITDYSSCLRRAIQEAWPLFIKGLPTEFEFPPLDPYFHKYHTEIRVYNDFVYGNVNGSTITVEGSRAIRFKAVRLHYSNDTFRLEIDTHTPKFDIKGSYNAHGGIPGLRVDEKGHFNITVESVRVPWDVLGSVKDDTLTIKHFRISPIFKNLKININCFNNPDIGKLLTIFVNGNWPVLYRMFLPAVSDYWDTYATDLVNGLFAKLSFSQVFP